MQLIVVPRIERTKRMKMADKIKYKTRLRDLRIAQGLTRMDLVRELGISYPTIMAWENDVLTRYDGSIGRRIQDLFGVTHDQLIYAVKEDANGEFVAVEDGAA